MADLEYRTGVRGAACMMRYIWRECTMNVRGLQKSMREYGMYFALLIIMVFFTILTNGVFISPRNISNLFDQMGYIAVLGVGMTLILIIRSIDISVGFVCGLTGAILATGLKGGTIPPVLVVLLVLSVGIMIGVYHGFLVTKLFMPAWVVSLAGMFVFRGALLLVTEGTGTIIVDNPFFVALGNGFIPDLLGGGKVHGLTMLLAGIAIVLLVVSMSLQRAQVKKYGLDAGPTVLFLAKILIISSIVLFFAWQLANYRGLSWTVVVVIVVVAIYHFFMSNTILGRHIYAVGANPEAAELSGVKVKSVTFFVLISMSFLAAVAGILYTARLMSASTSAGNGFEMDAIAAAYIGGVSASGGIGKVTGTIIGAIVISSLSSGMNLLQVGVSYQYIIRGLVLVIAVLFDVQSRKRLQ